MAPWQPEPINQPPNKWVARWQTAQLWLRRGWPFAATALFTLLSLQLYTILYPPPAPLTTTDVDTQIHEIIASATLPPAYSTQVYQIILPSLVFIQTKQAGGEEEGFGVGSGVVVNDGGDILTAYHVVADAVEIELIYADGTHTGAIIAASEPANDIAVLQPTSTPGLIVPAVLGNPNAMRVGDQAFAVGNPLGLAGSMSAGVISGFDRSIPIDDEGGRLEGLIQFDAAVNPGNSGGPLLNRAGQVVGIVTALANPDNERSFTGIGFAVPITTAGGAAGAPQY
ncbi:MAG: trypsin-like peptidase domain-containing protein [Ardenticatenaceae bacterium]|nr:trypsin-like peptidase domain-containing protein [Ardenticatenaceae bacterium]